MKHLAIVAVLWLSAPTTPPVVAGLVGGVVGGVVTLNKEPDKILGGIAATGFIGVMMAYDWAKPIFWPWAMDKECK